MVESITDTTKDNHYGDTLQIQEKRNALYEFIVSKLSGSYGIYTNYLDSDQNLNMDGYLYDFYDEKYKVRNAFITLCYINLTTLEQLPLSSDHIQEISTNMLEIIQNGYLSDSFPLYETRYQYETNSYNSENINTVESLLTILSLAEVKQQNPSSIRYLKEHVKKGTLYGQYTREGTPTNDIQSTAIYAITSMIGSQIGDKELYEDSIRRMSQYQIEDTYSHIYGSFGDIKTETVYSFDNLMALLAFAY